MSDVPKLKASMAYRYRLPITIVALICGWISSLFTIPLVKEHSRLDHQLDALAWGLLLAGIAVRAWASREISGKKKDVVVSTGPYALCRNPLYWGTFLIACSQLAFLRTAAFGLALCIPVIVYITGVVPAEERYLTAALGEKYEHYCQRTARWFPWWHPDALRGSACSGSRAYYRELATLACWIVLPGAAETICYLRELPNWPHWTLLK
jgi:protein-S-isoprenylcysteine O-methyltransferase Ste14